MIEPKRGKHNEYCLMVHPTCKCNTCQNDGKCGANGIVSCMLDCPVLNCTHYLADEPTKKGAANV